MEEKKWAITQEADLLMDLPLDVIVECTGNPEAGAPVMLNWLSSTASMWPWSIKRPIP
jgi:predicted homoserine dehydrogenase-like protein